MSHSETLVCVTNTYMVSNRVFVCQSGATITVLLVSGCLRKDNPPSMQHTTRGRRYPPSPPRATVEHQPNGGLKPPGLDR